MAKRTAITIYFNPENKKDVELYLAIKKECQTCYGMPMTSVVKMLLGKILFDTKDKNEEKSESIEKISRTNEEMLEMERKNRIIDNMRM